MQIREESSSPCANGQSSSISLYGKNVTGKKPTHDSGGKENMGTLCNQSDHTYCRIPTGDCKYQGRQGNESFIERMDIKQANIPESDTDFRTSGWGSICIQVVAPDPKVKKLATRSICKYGGCISNKLDTPKGIRLHTFCSYRESVSQSNEGQVYMNHNNISVAFPPIVDPVIENVYTRSNFHSLISKSFDRPKPKPTAIVSESNISLSSMEGLLKQHSAEGLLDQSSVIMIMLRQDSHVNFIHPSPPSHNTFFHPKKKNKDH